MPKFIHPPIPNDDLASLGVPFLSIDKDGNSILNTPVVELISEKGNISGKLGVVDVPMKVNEKVPLCSTYFYPGGCGFNFHGCLWQTVGSDF